MPRKSKKPDPYSDEVMFSRSVGMRELRQVVREMAMHVDQMSVRVDKVADKVDKLAEGDETTRKRIEEAEEARGRTAEAMFRKGLPEALAEIGIKISHVEPRRLRRQDREYDFVARNGRVNFVGEVKVRFRARDLAQLRSLLAKFREDYPEKAGGRALHGIVCGLVVDDDAASIARKEGLLVVEAKGEVKILAKPRQFRDYAA